MSGNLLEGLSPVTQTIESGKALAKYLGMKEGLPETIALANGARLTLSGKKDCYYMTTPKSCSCRAGQFGRMCKHRKGLESELQGIPANRWATGGNGPVMPEDRPKASSSASMLVDVVFPTTTPGEIEYWQAKQAQEA